MSGGRGSRQMPPSIHWAFLYTHIHLRSGGHRSAVHEDRQEIGDVGRNSASSTLSVSRRQHHHKRMTRWYIHIPQYLLKHEQTQHLPFKAPPDHVQQIHSLFLSRILLGVWNSCCIHKTRMYICLVYFLKIAQLINVVNFGSAKQHPFIHCIHPSWFILDTTHRINW